MRFRTCTLCGGRFNRIDPDYRPGLVAAWVCADCLPGLYQRQPALALQDAADARAWRYWQQRPVNDGKVAF